MKNGYLDKETLWLCVLVISTIVLPANASSIQHQPRTLGSIELSIDFESLLFGSPSQSISSIAKKYLDTAEEYLRKRELIDAIRTLETGGVRVPQSMTIKTMLAELYNRAGRYHDAVEVAQQVLNIVPSSVQPHDILGTAYLALNQFGNAIKEFNVVVRKAPDIAVGYYHLANAYFSKGRNRIALKNYELALVRDPNLHGALLRVAMILQEDGKHREAINRGRQLLAIKADDAFIHSVLGVSYEVLGEYCQAEESYRQAILLRPKFSYFRKVLAQFLVDHDRRECVENPQWGRRTIKDFP